ncbi:MAG TPA: peptidoglycan DD-metalloendopeptidase family protein [Candidatus Atribacteria bacterium]|nr:peptidoglycan DD-metalloendopeptidase family protein [Candidatus Atribacteria bacterium]
MRRVACWVLVFLILLFLNLPGRAQDLEEEISEQQTKLEKLRSEQLKLDQELDKLLKDEKNLVKEIENLDKQIESLEKNAAQSRAKILQLEAERAELQKEIKTLSQKIEEDKEKVKNILVQAYKYNGGVGFWELLMTTSDPNQWEEQWFLLRKYYQSQNYNLERYLEEKGTKEEKEKELAQMIRLELVLKEQALLENQKLAKLKDTREKMRQKIASDKKQFERSKNELVKAQKELENLIAKLQEDIKKRRESQPSVSIAPVKQGRLFWPVQGTIIEGFGERKDPRYGISFYNPGIDIGAEKGSPVFAAHDGVVILAQTLRGYGKTILLDHGDVITMYAHLSEIKVEGGQKVKGGEVIGTVGDTGLTERPLLHFEVRVGSSAREEDPLKWLK